MTLALATKLTVELNHEHQRMVCRKRSERSGVHRWDAIYGYADYRLNQQVTKARRVKEPANKVIDKLESGKRPTKKELEAAGYCLSCEGYGFHRIDGGPEEDDIEISCKKCGGTGEAADNK